jgi:hypothetical protein
MLILTLAGENTSAPSSGVTLHSYALNQTLTIVTKIILKYIWDCKLRFSIPNADGCLDNIKEKFQLQYEINSPLSRFTTNSGLPFFARANFINNNFP